MKVWQPDLLLYSDRLVVRFWVLSPYVKLGVGEVGLVALRLKVTYSSKCLWTFAHHKRNSNSSRGNVPDFRAHGRKPMSVLGLQLLEESFNFFGFARVIFRFQRKQHLFLLKTIENLGA